MVGKPELDSLSSHLLESSPVDKNLACNTKDQRSQGMLRPPDQSTTGHLDMEGVPGRNVMSLLARTSTAYENETSFLSGSDRGPSFIMLLVE